MGNICSSSQSSRDHDSVSNSESSPCYRGCQHGRRSTGSGFAANDMKQDRNGKMETTEKNNDSLNRQSVIGQNVDVREESSFASMESDPTLASPPASSQSRPVERSADSVPDTLRYLPETVYHMLNGYINCIRSQDRGANITLYIASADPSASATTDLIDAVSVEIKSFATSRDAPLQTFDLRHKAALIADNDDCASRIFLATLTRLMETTHVLPVLIFNDILGDTLLPRGIEVQDFQTAIASTDNEEEKLFVESWYHLDQQAQPPCYRLKTTPALAEEEVRERLLEIFIKVFSPELRDAYLTTIFEQEVHNSVCMSQELARRCVWIQKGGCQSSSEQLSVIEREHRRRVNALQKTLKGLLQENHILKYNSDTPEQLLSVLRNIIEDIREDIEAKNVFRTVHSLPHSILEEINQHFAFCQKAALTSVNRETALMAIKRYLTGNDRHPFIIYGRRGSGKTCLIARAAQNCHIWQPDCDIGMVLRFAALTPDSYSVRNLFHSVARQCSVLLSGRLPHVPYSLSEYKALLQDLFDENRSWKKTILIILDGVDQLKDFDNYAELLGSWLPRQLPPNMKLVLTLEDDHHTQQLRNRFTNSNAFHKLEELSPTEARNLFNACLLQHTHGSHTDIADSTEKQLNRCQFPLTVKILSWQTGLMMTYQNGEETQISTSYHSVTELLYIIENVIGKNEVTMMLSFLTSSRYGLCDYEMEQLCQLYIPSTTTKNVWPKLAHFLAPFLKRVLVGGLTLISWRDATIQDQMFGHCLSQSDTRQAIHLKMLEYYQDIWHQWKTLFQDQDASNVFSGSLVTNSLRLVRRTLDELPYHLCNSRQSIETEEWIQCFSDFAWLLAKLATSGVTQIIEDLNLALRHQPSDRLDYIKQILVLSTPALEYDYRQLYGQFQGRVAKIKAELHGVETWWKHCQTPLIPCLIPAEICLNTNQPDPLAESLTNGSEEIFFSTIQRLICDENHAAALSATSDEMSLWDFRTGHCFKVLPNLHQPLKVAPMSNNRCVVLCGRELRVYDVNTGEELLKLKGIMNQKLPLFGLHGDSHVVSLSRNRMYVNLISLENGDCVTTFKVGEDRFLNSLLVSDNGRILVCGDESKRPCSLLVWDLQAKKLIYDLKMNHHEFITRLSAITGEGTYVCCVCKELETKDPNFLVVYDLQSGTLFKKWKAGVNTIAVTIACQSSCVVASLEDSRILVWDLGTGNCRWTLMGHTSAADILNLDAEGYTLLSWDSRDNDRSLRLWNLSKGQDIATFTPDQRTTAAQLSANGQTVLVALAGRKNLVQLNLNLPHKNDQRIEAKCP